MKADLSMIRSRVHLLIGFGNLIHVVEEWQSEFETLGDPNPCSDGRVNSK